MLKRRLVAEGTGSALLLIGVVGSGIMAERLSPDDVGLQLFRNAAATAAVLLAIIVMFGRMFSDTFAGIEPSSAPMFIVMQLIGLALAVGLIRFAYPDTQPASDL